MAILVVNSPSPRILSLVAGTGSFAQLGAHAAADAHLAMTRADRWMKIRETRESECARSGFARRFAAAAAFLGRLAAFGNFFRHFPYSTTSTRWRTLWIMPRTDGVSSRSTT